MSRYFSLLRALFIYSITALLLTGCAQNPEGMLKRSANNKLFDTQGFDGGKRRPIYNKKYIATAKKNVISHNYDEDDYDYEEEVYDPALYHRDMYAKMAKKDLKRHKFAAKKKKYEENLNDESDDEYPDLYEGDVRLKDIPNRNIAAMEDEIRDLRKMLEEAKSTIEKQAAIISSGTEAMETKASHPAPAKKVENNKKAQDIVAPKIAPVKAQKAETVPAKLKENMEKKNTQSKAKKIEEKSSLTNQLLSRDSLLQATSDTDIASEVIKAVKTPAATTELSKPVAKSK